MQDFQAGLPRRGQVLFNISGQLWYWIVQVYLTIGAVVNSAAGGLDTPRQVWDGATGRPGRGGRGAARLVQAGAMLSH